MRRILRRFSFLGFSVTLVAASTSPIAFAAECATSSTNSGGYTYVAFKNTGTCTWTKPIDADAIDLLLVAGGGSGGSRHGAGGGAGGLFSGSSYSLSGITALDITVGSGGSAVTPSALNYAPGLAGSNSIIAKNSGSGSFSTLTAIGGGGGEAGGAGAQYGGSGGGSQSATASNYVPGQGNRGGFGAYSSGSWYSSGGGGGAGGVGRDYTSSSGGAGGPGAIWISAFTTSIATSLGLNQTNQTSGNQVYFAGGGGGSTTASTAGAGGLGGGGSAALGNNAGTSGTTNSGGGGGASGCCNGGYSGAGGSGIVIIRYMPDVTPPTFTNSANFTAPENSSTAANIATLTVSESSTLSIISGADSAKFSLSVGNGTTAYLRFATSPNFESPTDSGSNNIYNLTVRASDRMGLTADQSVTISVTNINEAPTITVNSSVATHVISQPENNTFVMIYTASDADAGSNLSFSLSGNDFRNFQIDSSTGSLSFALNPDFEDPSDSNANNSYVVIVTVSDGELIDTQTLTVTITNANESVSIASPAITGSAVKGVPVTITVTTNVGGKVRFFVGGKRISTCLSRTTSGIYPTYTATCSWKPAVTGRQLLTATLTPSDNTFTSGTSARGEVFVQKRAGAR